MLSTPIASPAVIFEGLKLLGHTDIRWLVIIPTLLNLILFSAATWLAAAWVSDWLNWLIASVPDWLEWLAWIIWLMFVLLALVIYSFTFTVFANLIGSPFYGIIAERVIALERGLTDKTPTSTKALLATAWGSFRRELQIIAYMLPRTLGIALLTVMISFVPIINILAPLIAASWAAWSLALQYMDYPGDSDELSFTQVRQRAGKQRLLSLSFGLSALVAAAIPLVNLLLLPATVVGGTLLWCREYSEI
ncbi:probable sulfate uptake protein [gamma proteobacterium HTCC2207]|uniref:Probable sulfate uptake protein n=1 Tax=gamma proteobacterium HTCC2207 TaxID=314287 RepID=Q1YQL3_9GAMM|nr:probable sulfate uptake protein [gamma proteobacterium HTCC2207]